MGIYLSFIPFSPMPADVPSGIDPLPPALSCSFLEAHAHISPSSLPVTFISYLAPIYVFARLDCFMLPPCPHTETTHSHIFLFMHPSPSFLTFSLYLTVFVHQYMKQIKEILTSIFVGGLILHGSCSIVVLLSPFFQKKMGSKR